MRDKQPFALKFVHFGYLLTYFYFLRFISLNLSFLLVIFCPFKLYNFVFIFLYLNTQTVQKVPHNVM